MTTTQKQTDKMTFGGLNVHSQKIHRFPRRRESEARIGEHDNAQRDQQDGNDGFGVHIESGVNFSCGSC